MRGKDSPSFRHLPFLRLGCYRGELRFGADDWIRVVLRQNRDGHIEYTDVGRGLAAPVRVRGEDEVCKRLPQHGGNKYSKSAWRVKARTKSLYNFPTLCVKHVSSVRAADTLPPRDHLPPVSVVTEEFNNAFHAHLASTGVFPVIVSARGQVQCRFQLASAVALFVLA